jgi:hypothetical protein
LALCNWRAVVLTCSCSSKVLTTSERSASMACDAVSAICVNCSEAVRTEPPLATVVSVSTPNSPFTVGAPKKPARPPPAETELSAWVRISLLVSK